MAAAERRGVYLHEGMNVLEVTNPHFDFRDEFDAALRVGGVTESIERRLYANFSTAVGEDVLRRGSFEFEFSEGENERLILTTADHRAFGDITRITLNGVKKRRAAGKPYERELAELVGMRELRRRCLDCPDGSTFVLSYPPGPAEDGYTGVSLTYVYRVEGDPGAGRRVRVMFYKNALSLEGHAQLSGFAEWVAAPPDSQSTPEFFVSSPIDISDNPIMQTADDVVARIDEIANSDDRFVVSGVGFGSSLAPETFASYEPQLRESAAFLAEALREELRTHSMGLDQKGLSELELAYSFARRAVKVFAECGQILTAHQLTEDCRWRRDVNRSFHLRGFEGGVAADSVVIEAGRLQAHLLNRYGDLETQRVGGGGCPPGMIASIGFSLDGFTVLALDGVSFGSSEKSWTYHSGTCRVCRAENTMVGPCDICKHCEVTFD
ncbi:hypothetical protein IH980_02150 [Patescibacteria group bacterium]|nr:hypothetical protein [Patescibacteria group bacterium]